MAALTRRMTPPPPPIDCATTPCAPMPDVVIVLWLPRVTLTAPPLPPLPLPPIFKVGEDRLVGSPMTLPPPPPIDCARMPKESMPVVEMARVELPPCRGSKVTAPPAPLEPVRPPAKSFNVPDCWKVATKRLLPAPAIPPPPPIDCRTTPSAAWPVVAIVGPLL